MSSNQHKEGTERATEETEVLLQAYFIFEMVKVNLELDAVHPGCGEVEKRSPNPENYIWGRPLAVSLQLSAPSGFVSIAKGCLPHQSCHSQRGPHLVTEPGGGVEAQPPQPDKGQHEWAMVPSTLPVGWLKLCGLNHNWTSLFPVLLLTLSFLRFLTPDLYIIP